MNQVPLHVIILAAGMGSRMRSSVPKVLHCLAAKTLLEHVVDASMALDPDCIHVVVGHGKEQVIAGMAEHSAKSRLKFIEQVEQLGTADAVKTAMPNVPENTNVLILTADVPLIKSSTLSDVVAQLRAHSLCLLTTEMDDPTGLGRIIRTSDGSLEGIVEERDATPGQRKITEINSGMMAARAARLSEWLPLIQSNNAQQEFYLTDIVGLANTLGDPITGISVADCNEVKGVNTRVQLAELERLWQRARAEQLMLQGVTFADPSRVDFRGTVTIGQDSYVDVNVVFEGDCDIGGIVSIGANSVIKNSSIGSGSIVHEHSVLDHTQLGNDVSVGPFARLRPGTKLGNGVRIGNFVETKNAVFADGAKANHLSYVGDASVGSNTNIGAGVITCNYDGANKFHTEIGENVFVGSDSQLVAPVTIGDGATIGAGSTITSDVKPRQLAISRARQRGIDEWQRPVKKKK